MRKRFRLGWFAVAIEDSGIGSISGGNVDNNGKTTETPRPVTAYWPAWSIEAAKLIGHEAVATIMQHHGGTRIYIPHRPTWRFPLLLLIGTEAVQSLCKVYGGLNIDVPKGEIAQITTRNRMIADDRQSGMSTADIARKYRLTERGVRYIYRKL